VVQAAYDVAVFVDAHVAQAEALAGLVVLLRRTLRRRSRRRRTAVIYGPRGEELKRVELDDD
jgi:hypothetical protein